MAERQRQDERKNSEKRMKNRHQKDGEKMIKIIQEDTRKKAERELERHQKDGRKTAKKC